MLAALLLLLPQLAHADAIEGPPTDCVPGSFGTSSHAGEWCEALPPCRTDADCAEDTVCGDAVDVCVVDEDYTEMGQGIPRPAHRNRVTGTCARCAPPGVCQRSRRCVERTVTSSCHCLAAGTRTHASLTLAGLAALAILAAVRRARRRAG